MTDDDELLSRDRSIMFGISHIGTRAKAAMENVYMVTVRG